MKVSTLNPIEAFNRPNSILIDVRSSMEFLFVGHPLKSFNVPWIDNPDWEINQNFATDIERLLTDKLKTKAVISTTDIILICRSGIRSLDAGKVLLSAGFESVFSMSEGFEGDINDDGHRGFLGGWRFHQLPWTQC